MIISSRSRVSNLLFSRSCINWLYATLATPGLLANVRNASLCVRRAGIPIASPSSRARSSDTIGTRAVISALLWWFPDCATGRAGLAQQTVFARGSQRQSRVRDGATETGLLAGAHKKNPPAGGLPRAGGCLDEGAEL